MKVTLLTLIFWLSVAPSKANLRGLRDKHEKKPKMNMQTNMGSMNTFAQDFHLSDSALPNQDEALDAIPCDVSLDVQCTVRNGTEDCDGLLPHIVDLCSTDDHPTSITMQYIGGNCNQTNHFHCKDYPGLSPSNVSYIVATDSNNDVYFEGNVNIDGSFLMSNNGTMITEDIDISIYSSPDKSELVQTMMLPLCSNSNSSSFHFQEVLGSTKLAAFESAARGSVTFQSVFMVDAVLTLYVTGTGIVNSLRAMSPQFGILYLTDQVNSVNLGGGNVASAIKEVTLDLSASSSYSMFANVVAMVPPHDDCRTSNRLKFSAGVSV